MTDAADASSTAVAGATDGRSTTAANTGVKKGLPVRSLRDAEEAAAKVWDVARRGTAAKDAVAKALGLKAASGGTWALYIALLRGFGLVKVTDSEVGLSELGLEIVQDADAGKRQVARRTAFFKLRAYKELVDDYDGTELPAVASIASKLRFEYGKTEEMALQAANAFIESLRHAGLMDGNVVRKTPISKPVPEPLKAEVSPEGEAEDDDEEVADALDAAWEEDVEEHEAEWDAETTASVALTMTLDLSKYRADEVIEILSTLGLARRS